MLRTKSLPIPQATSLDVSVCGKRTECMEKTAERGGSRLLAEESQMGICKDHTVVENDGWSVGKRPVQRIRRELGLRLPGRKPRGRRKGLSTGLPTQATHRDHVWCWDFIHDRTVRGGRLKMLTVLDEYTRECHLIHVARRVRAADVLNQLYRLIQRHGAPADIRSDNGSEFIEAALQGWLADAEIHTLYIDPGSPWQNGYIESFHARFREEGLEREQLRTLTEARVVLEDWRRQYNEVRPHKSLGLETPKSFARTHPDGRSGRATPSLRPSIDLLYDIEQIINPSRLTKALDQFG